MSLESITKVPWNANMDIKLIYNITCLADYLCAYATKCERMSKQALRTMVTCARNFDDAAIQFSRRSKIGLKGLKRHPPTTGMVFGDTWMDFMRVKQRKSAGVFIVA
jgi:hypothetical protein